MIFELFEPYLPFISFFIAITVNIFLIIKKVNWVILIVGNVIVAIIMAFFGLEEYNILTLILQAIVDFLIDAIGSIFSAIGDFFTGIFESIF